MNSTLAVPTPTPRQLAFRGQVEASAWWFPSSFYSESEVRKRVLRQWSIGARLDRYASGYVLHLTQPSRMRAELAPAVPLVANGSALLAAPWSQIESLKGLEARSQGTTVAAHHIQQVLAQNQPTPQSGIWVVMGGDWVELKKPQQVDVSQWLDAGQWEVPTTQSLGEIPAIINAIPPVQLDLRRDSGLAPADAKLEQFLQNWQDSQHNLKKESRPIDPNSPLARLSRFLTPKQSVGNVPIASPLKIVVSSLGLLFCALLFFLSSLFAPGPTASSAIIFSFFAFFVLVALAFLRGFLGAPRRSVLTVPLHIQNIARALAVLGLVFIALYNSSLAIGTCLCFLMVYLLSRAVGAFATLVGSAAGMASTVGPRAAARSSWENSVFGSFFSAGFSSRFGGSRGARTGWLSRLFKTKTESGTGLAQNKPKDHDDTADALRRFMADAAFWTGLMRLIGRGQARYIARMMEMFERGQWDEALRHAIPLGKDGELGWTPPPSLSRLAPRADLNISPQLGTASGSLNFGAEIQTHLRELYRRAFERLKEAGKIDEAAFVLAELLQNSEEAVAFLEANDRLERAAALAESRALPPGLVVRQWWIAGKRERALLLARAYDVFPDALLRLEKDDKWKPEAAALRLLWGNHLAQSGRFGAAIEAVWPLETGRILAKTWLERALEGSFSPSILVRALELEPQKWEQWKSLLDTLLNTETEDIMSARRRYNFARALATEPKFVTPEITQLRRVAARATLRALLRDGTKNLSAPDSGLWSSLQNGASDGALRADLRPPQVTPPVLRNHSNPVILRWSLNDRGALNAQDAVVLPDGSALVALGESGVLWLARDSRIKAHFDQSAHQIVASLEYNRFLLLARRDDSWRVCKLDLNARKVRFWCDLRMDCFAPTYDGNAWFIAQEKRIKALDCTQEEIRALWDSGTLVTAQLGIPSAEGDGTGAQQIAYSRTSLAALVHYKSQENAKFESWQWELPGLVLRRREMPTFAQETPLFRPYIDVKGTQFQLAWQGEELAAFEPLHWRSPQREAEITWQSSNEFKAFVGDSSAMICYKNAAFQQVLVYFDDMAQRILANFHFEGARTVMARAQGELWTIWDDCGRVIVFNAETGQIERDWRLNLGG